MTSGISVSSFSFHKHLPASLVKRRRNVSSKPPEPQSSTALYFSPFDAAARNSVRSCSAYAWPVSKSASYGFGVKAKGEDWRKTKRRKSLKRSSVMLKSTRAVKEVATGLEMGVKTRRWKTSETGVTTGTYSRPWKGSKATTHICKNIRR